MAGKYGMVIILFYICIVLLTAIYSVDSLNYKTVNNATNRTGTNNSTINETNVYNNFSAIAATPYDERTNNCTTKSIKFAEYLQSIGENTSIITINSRNGGPGHMAVVWRNEIYDPTIVPAEYGQPVDLYLDGIAVLGYDGFTVIEPYKG